MSYTWSEAKLGSLLTEVSRPERVSISKTYRRLGMKWYALGLFEKDNISGKDLRASKIYRIEDGDFIYNRLFAWKGSFGVAQPEHHNAYVSNEFPCFRIDSERLDSYFLWYYFSRPGVWEYVKTKSSGTSRTSRLRFKQRDLLEMTIPLPSLEEQRRIVAMLDAFAARIEDARYLLAEAIAETEAIAPSISSSIFDKLYNSREDLMTIGMVARLGVPKGWTPTPVEGKVPFIPMALIDQETGLNSSFEMRAIEDVRGGKVRFQTPAILLAKITPSTENNKTALIESLPTDGGYATTEVFAIHPKPSVEPKFLLYHLRTGRVRTELIKQMTGTSGRQRVPTGAVRNLRLTIPSPEIQKEVIAQLETMQSMTHPLKQQLNETLSGLGGLFSAVLERAFAGTLRALIPATILEEVQAQKAGEHERQREALVARQAAISAHEEETGMEPIKVNSPSDLTTLLRRLTRNGQEPVSAKELWQLSELADIDTFYMYLKQEQVAGRIVERREGYEIYLRPSDENKTSVG